MIRCVKFFQNRVLINEVNENNLEIKKKLKDLIMLMNNLKNKNNLIKN